MHVCGHGGKGDVGWVCGNFLSASASASATMTTCEWKPPQVHGRQAENQAVAGIAKDWRSISSMGLLTGGLLTAKGEPKQ